MVTNPPEPLSEEAWKVWRRICLAGLQGVVSMLFSKHRFVRLDKVLGDSRCSRTTAVRHHVWAVIKWSEPGFSYHDIADIWGVDHSSVISGIYRHEYRITSPCEPFKSWVAGIKKARAESIASAKGAA